MNPQPKPIKRRTVKAKRDKAKAANIEAVRDQVWKRQDGRSRIASVLERFHFMFTGYIWQGELAHVDARGMGGNPDLSRDTTANTIWEHAGLHQGPRSMHSGHIKIEALTDRGMDGPIAVTFYEKLPTEL